MSRILHTFDKQLCQINCNIWKISAAIASRYNLIAFNKNSFASSNIYSMFLLLLVDAILKMSSPSNHALEFPKITSNQNLINLPTSRCLIIFTIPAGRQFCVLICFTHYFVYVVFIFSFFYYKNITTFLAAVVERYVCVCMSTLPDFD